MADEVKKPSFFGDGIGNAGFKTGVSHAEIDWSHIVGNSEFYQDAKKAKRNYNHNVIGSNNNKLSIAQISNYISNSTSAGVEWGKFPAAGNINDHQRAALTRVLAVCADYAIGDYIARVDAKQPSTSSAAMQNIIRLARRFGCLARLTGMLLLELKRMPFTSDADKAKRTAAANILNNALKTDNPQPAAWLAGTTDTTEYSVDVNNLTRVR